MPDTSTQPLTDAPLILSVSGARGIVGRSMTPDVAARFAAAFGSFLKARTGADQPLVCVGRDSRRSGDMLQRAAIAGLSAVGCRVIDLGIVATPTVSVMVDHCRALAGLIITASHNPVQWNGIKCLIEGGVAPPPAEIDQIIQRFHHHQFDYAEVNDIPEVTSDMSGHNAHVQRITNVLDVELIHRAQFKVVLDSVNGAGGPAGRQMLEALGCDVVHLNGGPTGEFAHGAEPVAENLTQLCTVTAAENAVIGFAQDPDADRLAIVDENGHPIGEEYTLVFAAKQYIEQNGPCTIAANLSTSRMIDDLAAQTPGCRVVRTAVGEANIAQIMQQENAPIGGEGNGGVIFPRICQVRDSLSGMALVLGLLANTNKKVSELLDMVPRYVMIKHKFDITDLQSSGGIEQAIGRVRATFDDARLNTADGVRIDFDDGWVHLRPSNTEPIIRLIAEAETESRAWELIDEVAVAARLQ